MSFTFKETKQRDMEERYNKKNIPDVIKLAIADTEIAVDWINNVAVCIKKFATGFATYSYKSKQTRAMLLLNETREDPRHFHQLALELLSIVLPIERPMPIQAAVSAFKHHMPKNLEELEKVKLASELIAVSHVCELYRIIAARDSESGSMQICSNLILDSETKQKIADKQYLPPMIVKPELIETNFDSGYTTFNDCVILGHENAHNEPVSLDVLNILNQQALSLDKRMLSYVEAPNKECDTPEKVENFKRLQNSSTKVYQEIIENGNKFFNTHKFDKRGRVYSCGYHVHIQSTDYKKSLINFADEELIGL